MTRQGILGDLRTWSGWRAIITLTALVLAGLSLLLGCNPERPSGPRVAETPRDTGNHAPQTQQPSGRMEFSAEKVEFGDIVPHDDHKRAITVTNAGPGPLVVAGVKTTCPCIMPELDPIMLAEGESAELVIKLKLADYAHDEVRGFVHVDSGQPEGALSQVAVTGNILAEFTVEPKVLDFGRIKRGQESTATLTLKQTGQEDVILQSIETTPGLAAEFVRQAETPAVYTVTVTATPPEDMPRLRGKVTLVTNIERIPRREVRVSGEIQGIDCNIAPKVVVFGPNRSGDAIGTVTLTGSVPFAVSETTPDTDAIVATVDSPSLSKKHAIAFRLTDQAQPGKLLAKVRVELIEGTLRETRDIRVYGTVQE